jgi:hypothetical protein
MDVPSLIFLANIMKVKYSEKIDREIFKEVTFMGKKLSPIFGFQFPKVKFDKKITPIAKAMVKVLPAFMYEKRIITMMKKMYGKDMPEITIYINTTPFSTWNVEAGWVSVSMERGHSKFFQTVCHEINHFMYDYTFKTRKYEDTEIKEILTVLNNIFGIEDKGWKIFSEKRKAALDFYEKTKDFKKTIEYVKTFYKLK